MTHCPICSSSDSHRFCSAVDRIRRSPDETWLILRCGACGFGWTEPQVPEDKIASYYPSSYLGDTEHSIQEFFSGKLQKSRSWRKEVEKTRLLERYVGSGRILDIGCGEGKFLWALDPSRWERTGLELNRHVVTLVRDKFPGLDLICGDIDSTRLAPATFDVLTFWHVLEHLPNPRRVIKSARRLLRSGGLLIVSLPNLESLQARLFRRHWYAFDDVPRHLYHFSRYSLEMLLIQERFSIKQHFFFSRDVNFHSWKYSLINWSEANWGGRLPYYVCKPLLFLLPLLEILTGRYGMLTTVAEKAD